MAFPEESRKLALKVLMVAPVTATLEVLAPWTQVNTLMNDHGVSDKPASISKQTLDKQLPSAVNYKRVSPGQVQLVWEEPTHSTPKSDEPSAHMKLGWRLLDMHKKSWQRVR